MTVSNTVAKPASKPASKASTTAESKSAEDKRKTSTTATAPAETSEKSAAAAEVKASTSTTTTAATEAQPSAAQRDAVDIGDTADIFEESADSEEFQQLATIVTSEADEQAQPQSQPVFRIPDECDAQYGVGEPEVVECQEEPVYGEPEVEQPPVAVCPPAVEEPCEEPPVAVCPPAVEEPCKEPPVAAYPPPQEPCPPVVTYPQPAYPPVYQPVSYSHPEICPPQPRPYKPPVVAANEKAVMWGDPHVIVADEKNLDKAKPAGSNYDFKGKDGKTYNLLDDTDLAVNAKMKTKGDWSIITESYIAVGKNGYPRIKMGADGRATFQAAAGQPFKPLPLRDGKTNGSNEAMKAGLNYTYVKGENGLYTLVIKTPEYDIQMNNKTWKPDGKTPEGYLNVAIASKNQGVFADGLMPEGLLGETFDVDSKVETSYKDSNVDDYLVSGDPFQRADRVKLNNNPFLNLLRQMMEGQK